MNNKVISEHLNIIQNSINIIRQQEKPKDLTFTKTEVLKAVCAHFEIAKDELMGKGKKGATGEARIIYAYILFKHVSGNKSEIARWMNRADSNSAIKAIDRAECLLNTNDKIFTGHLTAVLDILNN
jgi:chromosomal replication initiation ATPase DnaA